MSIIQIQAVAVGYQGNPATVYSAYDTTNEALAVAVKGEYRRDRRDGCILLTNDATLRDRDCFFSDDRLHDAIAAYFSLSTGLAIHGPRLAFSDRSRLADPSIALDRDGMDANGPRVRVSDSASNAHIATLMTCWYAVRAASAESTVEMADDLLSILMAGGIVTIGGRGRAYPHPSNPQGPIIVHGFEADPRYYGHGG